MAMSGVESSDRRGIPSSWVTGLSMFGTSVAAEHDTTLRDHIGRHRDIRRRILGIADAEDAIRRPSPECGAPSGATAATSHLLVRALLRDTVPYRGRPFWLSSSSTMASRTF